MKVNKYKKTQKNYGYQEKSKDKQTKTDIDRNKQIQNNTDQSNHKDR